MWKYINSLVHYKSHLRILTLLCNHEIIGEAPIENKSWKKKEDLQPQKTTTETQNNTKAFCVHAKKKHRARRLEKNTYVFTAKRGEVSEARLCDCCIWLAAGFWCVCCCSQKPSPSTRGEEKEGWRRARRFVADSLLTYIPPGWGAFVVVSPMICGRKNHCGVVKESNRPVRE